MHESDFGVGSRQTTLGQLTRTAGFQSGTYVASKLRGERREPGGHGIGLRVLLCLTTFL